MRGCRGRDRAAGPANSAFDANPGRRTPAPRSRIRDTLTACPLAARTRERLHEGMVSTSSTAGMASSTTGTVASVVVGVGPVSFADVVAVARGRRRRSSSADDALAAIDRARAVVEELAAAPTPAYGISTGFGALATRHIPTEMRAQLQRSLVRSHAAGSGPEVEREVVRGADAAAALDAGDRPHRRPAARRRS